MALKIIKCLKWNNLEAPIVTKRLKLQEFVTVVGLNTNSVRKHCLHVLFFEQIGGSLGKTRPVSRNTISSCCPRVFTMGPTFWTNTTNVTWHCPTMLASGLLYGELPFCGFLDLFLLQLDLTLPYYLKTTKAH